MKTELAPTTKILDTLEIPEYNLKIVLAEVSKGFSVLLRDEDADEAVGCNIYPTRSAAETAMVELFKKASIKGA